MSQLKLTDTKFTLRDVPAEKYDLDNYFTNENTKITMIINRSLEYQIVDRYGVDSYEIIDDNRIKFDLVYTDYQYAMEFIRSLGDNVYILSPKWIIDELKTTAEKILEMYK
ncbi:hypothetical protein Amet_3508 [Alkaliphilus metalliredigens QYMF]|uniref:WCX domain-containing protein n=1 Tax=Alkaliphilus metalliredigens (strain QYMF) TaxID=293826 RepID=A6TTW7_ALKMQ|nr:WYL domain-containing protein [Alkaliphilus metalliredigens]ABR49635.1 hypothetical protein Amet_3508 [Alkaliphilus metalliredigens QYMF]